MKNILQVYRRDLKSICSNPIALLIIAGICLLPSLYAWVNIQACWNPYENTSTLPVAVVNLDQGTTYQNKTINAGNAIVNQLKSNKQIGWKFVDKNTADLGVIDGTYFAVIEIPANFSASFLNILTGNTKKPEIIYKVDTKDNPVALKITETAKNSLVDQISTSFISAINKTLFSSFNRVGQEAEANKSMLLQWKEGIIQADRNMNLILSLLQDINSRSSNLNSFLIELKSTLPAADSELSALGQVNTSNAAALESMQNTFTQSSTHIGTNLANAQASAERIDDLLATVASSSSNSLASQANSNLAQISSAINALNEQFSTINDFLRKLTDIAPTSHLSKLIATLKTIQNSLTAEAERINSLQQELTNSKSINQTLLTQITKDTESIASQISTALNLYHTNVQSDLNTIGANSIKAANDAFDLIRTAQGLQAQIDNLISTAISGSQLTAKVSNDIKTRLLEYQDIISKLSAKLQLVDNNDLAQIISILQSDPEFMGSFASSPFNLREEPIYGVPNYGSAMAPLYTILALWVGTIILASLLKTEVAYFEGIETLTIREKHFGKMLTFITLALIQGLIATIGDKLLLGVYSVNTPLMIVVALMSSLTFVIITYTLVSLLGNLGKALAIIYMIIQLAGSGGTYPIQVDPLIYKILQPTFPFTYAIEAFREAIAGPLISKVFFDFVMLIVISVIFLLLGFFFKGPLSKYIHKFEAKFKLSGIGE